MADQVVEFQYRPGSIATDFGNVRLCGGWDARGLASAEWRSLPMTATVDRDGLAYWQASVAFPAAAQGVVFRWGVLLDRAGDADLWGVAAEVDDLGSTERVLSFTLQPGLPAQAYWLNWWGRLGAHRVARPGHADGVRFSVWAPNALNVALAIGDPAIGYIADDGNGMVATFPMVKDSDGLWEVRSDQAPALAGFEALIGTPYMYRIERDDGAIVFRTDLWSLMQIGAGDADPRGAAYAGPAAALDGPKSCSVVCDPTLVVLPGQAPVSASAFWSDEYDIARPVPDRLDDLVIYELHVGALGFGHVGAGTFDDAIAFIDHLEMLGVNAVELLPVAEFGGTASWGYGSSHFFAIEQAAGGTDRLKLFVKMCHQRGIAVILDVCYNHFDPDAERAEWNYDSSDPVRNIYYWYEGVPTDYPNADGGYIDNISSGWAPRYTEEAVRQLFIASAAYFADICHVDGFRLDQTSSIHEYGALHSDGRRADRANAFGTKFLKQWTRTMRLLKPGLFLTAEDYSNWSAMTEPSLAGDGLGFDATWYGDFHHGLVEYHGGSQAHLLKEAGYGDDRPLAMTSFAGALVASAGAKVVYTQSHDDCGNREDSARGIVIAVDGAPLVGATRSRAEARVRFAAGMSLLSAGSPMFFMGEEVGAQKPYRYDDFIANREDFADLAANSGAHLLRFYQDLIALSIRSPTLRTSNIQVSVTHDQNRVVAFHRWDDDGEYLVGGTLANAPYASGYWLAGSRLAGAGWREVFNSDAARYGGDNVGNAGQMLVPAGDALNIILPAAGFVVLQRGR
jgi:1,4-alpha-glucan branching enzyme